MTAPVRERIIELVARGHSDDEIIVKIWGGHRKRAAGDRMMMIRLAREGHRTAIRWRGPWPVSYIRNDGELVYRVGEGHDVPERSLKAFGFEV